jgi:hypothetical protein
MKLSDSFARAHLLINKALYCKMQVIFDY